MGVNTRAKVKKKKKDLKFDTLQIGEIQNYA